MINKIIKNGKEISFENISNLLVFLFYQENNLIRLR